MKKITIVIPMSPEGKIDALESTKKQKNVKIIVVRGLNPSRNRNIGIEKAGTEFIAFINGHTILSENWGMKLEEFFKEHPEIDMVGGPQLNYGGDNNFTQASGYALGSVFGGGNINKRYKKGKLNLNADETSLTSANLICRKRVLQKVKFDEKIYPGEDPKFISDSIKAGFKVAYSPDIIVYNRRRGSFLRLTKQIYNYGVTRPKKERFAETLKMPFFIIPSLFLIYVVLIVFLIIIGRLNLLVLIPAIFYILLNFYFSFINSIKNKDIASFFLLLIIHPTIHLSYGLGFLISTIKNNLKGHIKE